MSLRYKKDDIVDIDLGKPPKEVKGHEQGYDRPCVKRKRGQLGITEILKIHSVLLDALDIFKLGTV